MLPLVHLPITDEEQFQLALDSHCSVIEMITAAREQVQPMLFVITQNKMVGPAPLAKVPNEKWSAVIQRMLKDLDAEGYILISEAWTSTSNGGEPRVLPSEDPKRKEQAIVMWEYKRKQGMRIAEITDRKVGPWKEPDAMDGRLTKLCPGARGN